ncbi:unnamed protein product [Tuber aestivum]|uniref:Transmembrane protein n=1 Tax=Tuber aestivum TaxID=59557 RepID=A0A292PPF5_9PEZI|nr:unnamed protein product [Tuber aestivum]
MRSSSSFHSYTLMSRAVWIALLFMLSYAPTRGAAGAAFIGRARVEHVGRVMSYGLDPRGERKGNSLIGTGWVGADTAQSARNKGPNEAVGHASNSSRTDTALLITIGTLIPLCLLAIWLLVHMRKRPAEPRNDPEHQANEYYDPAAYPLGLVSQLRLPQSGPRSTIPGIPPSPPPPPPPAHQNGQNGQHGTETSLTYPLTSAGASSTALAENRVEETPRPSIFTRLRSWWNYETPLTQNEHREINRMGAGRGEGEGSLVFGDIDLTELVYSLRHL